MLSVWFGAGKWPLSLIGDQSSKTPSSGAPHWFILPSKVGGKSGYLLDALIRPAFVLILHDTTDELVILLQELKDQRKGQCSASSELPGTLPPRLSSAGQ